MDCHGNGKEHCCWVAGKPCQFLREDELPNRYWSCGLLNELGTWEAVHQDPRYLTHVRPAWDKAEEHMASPFPDCGDWRISDQCCFGGKNPPVHNQ